MKKALITIQQDQFSAYQLKQLNTLIKQNYRRYVSSERLLITWMQIPQDQMYCDYKPSQSSIITIEAPDGFPQHKRVNMLKNTQDQWLSITNQVADNLMLTLIDSSLFSEIVASNQERLSLLGKLKMLKVILSSVFASMIRRSPILINPNINQNIGN